MVERKAPTFSTELRFYDFNNPQRISGRKGLYFPFGRRWDSGMKTFFLGHIVDDGESWGSIMRPLSLSPGTWSQRTAQCLLYSVPAVFSPHCNQFVSPGSVIRSFHLYYPSLGFMPHYSLEPSLLLLHQFLLCSRYLELDLKCQPFLFLLCLNWVPIFCQASPSPARF